MKSSLKTQFALVAVAALSSGGAFAQAIPITMSANIVDVPCVVNAADSKLTIDFATVEVANLGSATAKTVALNFDGCKANQTIKLAARTTNGGPGTAAGRLAVATGIGKAEGVEIKFDIGAAAVGLVVGGVEAQVGENADSVPRNIAVPFKAELVKNGDLVVPGEVRANIFLTATY